MNKKTIIIGFIVVAVIATAVVLYLRYKKKNEVQAIPAIASDPAVQEIKSTAVPIPVNANPLPKKPIDTEVLTAISMPLELTPTKATTLQLKRA